MQPSLPPWTIGTEVIQYSSLHMRFGPTIQQNAREKNKEAHWTTFPLSWRKGHRASGRRWFFYYTLDWVHVHVNLWHAKTSVVLGVDDGTGTEVHDMWMKIEEVKMYMIIRELINRDNWWSLCRRAKKIYFWIVKHYMQWQTRSKDQ